MKKRLTEIAHECVEEVLNDSSIAIDATAGNGHDTVFLASRLSNGIVFSFDIQEQAIESTKSRLKDLNLSDRVKLFCRSHSEIKNCVDKKFEGRIDAVLFNLGYLPKGDHGIITKSESTIAALNQSLRYLSDTGVLSVMVYPDHAGGKEEAESVMEWTQKLSQDWNHEFIQAASKSNMGPFLLFIKKDTQESVPS